MSKELIEQLRGFKDTPRTADNGYSDYPVDFRLQLAGFDESHHG